MSILHVKSDAILDWTGTVTVHNSQASTTTANATDLVRPTDWNSGHNMFFTLTGNTSLSSTASGTNIVFAASGPSLSVIGSSDTVIFSSPAYVSSFKNPIDGGLQSTSFAGLATSHAQGFFLPEPGSFSFFRIPVSLTTGASTSFGSTTTTSQNISIQATSTWNAVVYSIGTGANSRSLQSVASGSGSWVWRQSLSISSGAGGSGTVWSLTQAGTFQIEGNSSSTSTLIASSLSSYNFTNTLFSNFGGGRFLDIPFANTLSGGPYWVVFGMSSSSASNATAISTATAMFPRYSNHYMITQLDSSFGLMNVTSTAFIGGAVFSTAGGGTTNSINIIGGSLVSSASQPVFPIQFLRIA